MILLESRGVKFRVQYPNASGHEVELEGTVAILGRDPSCDLVLNDVKCSRRHAVVEAGYSFAAYSGGALQTLSSTTPGSPFKESQNAVRLTLAWYPQPMERR